MNALPRWYFWQSSNIILVFLTVLAKIRGPLLSVCLEQAVLKSRITVSRRPCTTSVFIHSMRCNYIRDFMIGGSHLELTNEIRVQSNELHYPKLIGPSCQTSFSRTFLEAFASDWNEKINYLTIFSSLISWQFLFSLWIDYSGLITAVNP